MGEFNVNKSDGSLEQTAGMPSEYPATQVMMSDGVTSVEEAVDDVKNNGWVTLNANVKYKVTGGLVYVNINIANTSGNWTSVGNMPEGLRPNTHLYSCAFYRSSDSTFANMYINYQNGSIQIQSTAAVANGYIIYPKE